jgi:hypothetical protein
MTTRERLFIPTCFFAGLSVRRRLPRMSYPRSSAFIRGQNQNSDHPSCACDNIDCAEEITGCNSSPVRLLSISWKIPHPHRR